MNNCLENLKCLCCGSNEMVYKNGMFECPHCNSHHIIKDNNFVRLTEKEDLLASGDLFLEWGKYGKALIKYTEVTEKWPMEPRGWWGIVNCITKNLTEIIETTYIDAKEYMNYAFKTSDKEFFGIITPLWEEYEKKVLTHIDEEKRRIAEEKREKDELSRKQKEEQDKRNKEITRIENRINIISIVILCLTNIGYIILIALSDIIGTIYHSPECIGYVAVGGLISTIIVGKTSGLLDFIGVFWIPTALNGISVIMMIAGMLSHNTGIFGGLLVLIFFIAIGGGVTAFLGWIGFSVMANSNSSYDIASKIVDKKYK